MKPDASLLLQMQLALMGIVLVTGLFYLWRSLCRIEDKVTRLTSLVSNQDSQTHKFGSVSGGASGNVEDFRSVPLNFADADSAAEELMKQVFGDTEEVVLIHSSNLHQQTTSGSGQVVIEDATPIAEPEREPEREPEPEREREREADPEPSEADTDVSNPLSKSKLNKMTPEQLKELATQRGLSTEGNKRSLIDRLLGLTKD